MNTAVLKKLSVLGILCLFLLTSLGGCVKDYTRKDIKKYVRNQCGIWLFAASVKPEESMGEDGYTDLMWTIYRPNKLHFHVLDDRYWGLETLTNRLWTDYDDVMLKHYSEHYDFEHLFLESHEEQQMVCSRLKASFRSRSELRDAYTELHEFSEHLKDKKIPKDSQMKYSVEFDNPLRYNTALTPDGNIIIDGDCRGLIMESSQDFNSAEENYILCCLDYQFRDNLSEFTQDEIRSAVKKSPDRIGIYRGKDKGYEYYDDLVSSRYGHGISYGTLCEILIREGHIVEGSPDNYTYRDKEGNEYRFSYEFYGINPNDSDSENSYYYTKNGEAQWLSELYGCHLNEEQIFDITGIQLTSYLRSQN